MSLIDTLIEKAGLIRKANATPKTVSSSSNPNDPFAVFRASKRVDPSKAFEAYSGWVYACIRAIAEEVAKTRFRLIKINNDESEEEIYDHELLDILEGVNPQQTGMELRYTIAAHLEAIGNAYLYLEGVEKEGDKPDAIYILDASRVKVIVNRGIFPGIVEGYEYRTNTNTYTFKPHQIIHFKYSDPADPYEGIGTVQAAAQWIDADNYAMEFNRRFFLNGARIGGILEASQAYTTETLEYMKKSFENAHRGVDNAHKVLALPVGVKYQKESDGVKDMDFANMSLMMRDRILAAFRVPRTALGITDDVNRANAEATDYVFAARTIKPKIEFLCSYLNEFLVPRYGDNIYLTFEDPTPENRELTIKEAAAALGNAPALSVNEAREKYFGHGKIKGGDEVMIPFSLTPLGAPDAKAMNKPAVKGGKIKGRRLSRFARNAKLRKSIAGDIAKALTKEVKLVEKAIKSIKKKGNVAELDDAGFEPVYKGFLNRVLPYETKLRDAIRSYNGKQKIEVLSKLENIIKSFNAKTKAIDPTQLLDQEYAVAGIVDLATPILSDLYSKEGKEAAALLGITDLDPLTPEARKALEKAIKLLADSYTDETLSLLKAKLSQGISEGLGISELTNLVSDIYEFNDMVRAQRVAQTETFRIANEATKEAWKQTGVVKTIKWYTATDERVCPTCGAQHNKVISIDDDFYKKGDEVTGTDGSKITINYSNIGAPPLHVSCRCYTRPEEIAIE